MQIGPLETNKPVENAPSVNSSPISTKAFHAAYIVAAIVASLGWVWVLAYFAAAIFEL